MLDKFMQLLEQSVILQAVLTMAIWGVILVLYLKGTNPPDVLLNAGMLILGYYFGAKFQYLVGKAK